MAHMSLVEKVDAGYALDAAKPVTRSWWFEAARSKRSAFHVATHQVDQEQSAFALAKGMARTSGVTHCLPYATFTWPPRSDEPDLRSRLIHK